MSVLKEDLHKRTVQKIPTESLVKMAEFVLSNNYYEFNGQNFQQISGTAMGIKSPPDASIYMDQVKNGFLATQEFQRLLWLLMTIFLS